MPTALGTVASHRTVTAPTGPPVTGYVGWWDAADAASITASAGAVSQWNDKSGNSHHLTQTVAANKPTTGTRTLNGRNVLDVSGGDYVNATGWTLPQPLTLFIVCQSDETATGVNRRPVAGSGNSVVLWTDTGNDWLAYAGGYVYYNKKLDLAAHILTATVNGTTSFAYYDGTQTGTGNSGGFSLIDISIGSEYGGLAWDGVIAEVIVYDRVLSTVERQQVESYLTAKWIPTYTDVLLEPFNDFSQAAFTSGATIVAGRTGTAMQATGTGQLADWVIPVPAQSDVLTIGFAWRRTDALTTVRDLFNLYSDGSTLHNQLTYNPAAAGNQLAFLRGSSTQIGSATITLNQNVWYYIEVQVKLHVTTGSFIVRVDGTVVMNVPTANTKNGGTATVYQQVRLITDGSSRTGQWDDMYITTGAGAPFKGSITIP